MNARVLFLPLLLSLVATPIHAAQIVTDSAITTNTTWGAPEDTVVVNPPGATLTIHGGATLTILPGTTVAFMPAKSLVVGGASPDSGFIEADGSGAGISFQLADSQTQPWGNIRFSAASRANISNCVFRDYGSYPCSGPVRIVAPLFSQNAFVHRADGKFNAIELTAGNVVQSATLSRPPTGFCYITTVNADITVGGPGTAVLTIETGTVLKVNTNTYLGMGITGRLMATGVVFTSAHDDTLGDTNGNGASTTGGPGQWEQLRFFETQEQSMLNGCTIRFGGQNSFPDARNTGIAVIGSSPTVSGCVIKSNFGSGLHVGSGSPQILGCVIRDNTVGIRCVSASATPSISSCALIGNGDAGLEATTGATPTVTQSNVVGNGNTGVRNLSTLVTLSATGNWWGDASGPNDASAGPPDHNPGGTGNATSDYVAYRPWALAPYATGVPVVIAPATITTDEGSLIHFTVSVSAPGGSVLSLDATGSAIDAGGVFSPAPSNESGTFTWTPSYSQASTYSVTFTANNQLSGAATTVISVTDVEVPDFSIDSVSVGQPVVSANLLKNRATVVRVYVRNNGSLTSEDVYLNGILHVLDPAGVEVLPPRAPDRLLQWPASGSFGAPARQQGLNTLNFYLAPTEVYLPALKFWVEIDSDDAVVEGNEANNSNQTSPKIQQFLDPQTLRIAYCTISTLKKDPIPEPDIATAAELTAKVYPAAVTWEPTFHLYGWAPPAIGWERFADLRLTKELWLLNRDRRRRSLPEYDKLIGFFYEWPFGDVAGKTFQEHAVCMLNALSSGKKLTVAHELGHTFDLMGEYYEWKDGIWKASDGDYWDKSACPGGVFPCENYPAILPPSEPPHPASGVVQGRFVADTAFDVAVRRPAAWGPADLPWWSGDSTVQGCVHIPQALHSNRIVSIDCLPFPARQYGNRAIGFMGSLGLFKHTPGLASNQVLDLAERFAWITNDDYELLVKKMYDAEVASTQGKVYAGSISDSTQLWLFATITSDDQGTVDQCWVFDTGLEVQLPAGSGYSLDFYDAGGITISAHSFGLTFEQGDSASLSVRVPLPPAATRIAINRSGSTILSRAISPTPPTVEFVSPLGSGPLSGTVTVAWDAADADGDATLACVYFSADAGESWMPIALDITGSSLVWDADAAPGAASGSFKVVVSDGVWAAEAVSVGPFFIADRAPRVAILAPRDSSAYVEGGLIRCEGSIVDAEMSEGLLDSLRWTLDGEPLGVGATFQVPAAVPGWHMIRLAGQDYHGTEVADSVRVRIRADDDSDGMPNDWEILYSALDPQQPDGYGDYDADSLSNYLEFVHGTDPMALDTDGDGYTDGAEVRLGSDPTRPDGTPTGVDSGPMVAANPLSLAIFPSPFSASARIHYNLTRGTDVRLRIFDVRGRLVKDLLSTQQGPGRHVAVWDGRTGTGEETASGIYFMRLETASQREIRRVVRLK
jgi:hypothetical protein